MGVVILDEPSPHKGIGRRGRFVRPPARPSACNSRAIRPKPLRMASHRHGSSLSVSTVKAWPPSNAPKPIMWSVRKVMEKARAPYRCLVCSGKSQRRRASIIPLGLYQFDPRIVKHRTTARYVHQTGVLEDRVHTHRGVSVKPRGAMLIPLDGLSVHHDIG